MVVFSALPEVGWVSATNVNKLTQSGKVYLGKPCIDGITYNSDPNASKALVLFHSVSSGARNIFTILNLKEILVPQLGSLSFLEQRQLL